MSLKPRLDAYRNADRHSPAESEDPHAMISVLFDELIRKMEQYRSSLQAGKDKDDERNASYARSLSILHVLQSSLDFEQGGEIADNLFRLYEFARQQLLSSFRNNAPERLDAAISSLTEIRNAWHQINASEQSAVS